MTLLTISILALLAQTPAAAPQRTPAPQAPTTQHADAADALQLQVTLDRAGFSPGPIDGRMGSNTKKALELFNKSGNPQQPSVPPTTTYRISAEDAAGPFIERLPDDMMEAAKLPALGYASVHELLSERFHSTPAFLQQLNPGVTFAAGQEIQVPNVEPMSIPAPAVTTTTSADAKAGRRSETPGEPVGTSGRQSQAPAKPDVTVTVSKNNSALTVTDAAGRVVLYAPVTTGSEHDPLPLGEWKVTTIQFNPKFRYNPDLFWDADASQTKATIQPGPNNPVGLVWIDISKEHYGLHGTPEPATIGRTQSHGCVRLTNWDALRLAALVQPGTRVVFTE